MNDLWKFKKSTNKKCEDCGHPLQIREKDGKEVLVCSFCEYSESLQPRRVRRKEDIEELVVEPRKTYRPTVRRNQ